VTASAPTKQTSSTLTSFLRGAIDALDYAEYDGEMMLADAGILIKDYEENGKRVPTSLIAKSWDIVTSHIADPAVGIRAALRHFNPAEWHSLGLAILCSSSIREALERTVRFSRIVSDWAPLSLHEDSTGLSIVVTPNLANRQKTRISYAAMEFGVTAMLVVLNEIYPDKLQPTKIRLLRPAREASAEFADLLGCPVSFGNTVESVTFSRQVVGRQLPASNAPLATYHDILSSHYVDEYGKEAIATVARRAILRSLTGKGPRIDAVARSLNMSARKLQRRLSAEQTTFESLLQEVRIDLALKYLASDEHSLAELSFLLGFSSQSNFSRAFKLWFGISPSQFKKSRPGP